MLEDLRAAGRGILRHPSQSAVAVIALGLAIGLTTAIFSIVWGSLYRGLPFEGGDRLVRIQVRDDTGELQPTVPLGDYLAWQDRVDAFDGLAAWYGMATMVTGDGDYPERYNAAFVTANFFDVVGVEPLLGRRFKGRRGVLDTPPAALISHDLWKQRFNGDPGVIGRSLELWIGQVPIIGVMPEGFRFPLNQDVWTGIGMLASSVPPAGRDSLPIQVLGRLDEGMTAARVEEQLQVVAAGLSENSGMRADRERVAVASYVVAYAGGGRESLHRMAAACIFFFVIACANVANILLGRAVMTSRSVAIRGALGAGRLQMARSLLLESGLLASIGGLVGVGIAWWGIRTYNRLGGLIRSFWVDIDLHPEVLLFAVGVAIVAAISAGVLPALQLSRVDATTVLAETSQPANLKTGKISAGLVIVQVALVFTLMTVTSLMTRSVLNLNRFEFGASPQNLLTGSISPPRESYSEVGSRLELYDRLTRRLDELPGIDTVALTTVLPGERSDRLSVDVEEGVLLNEAESAKARLAVVTPRFFETMGAPVLQGRTFRPSDDADGQQVALVNASFAKRHFEDGRAVGRRIRIAPGTEAGQEEPGEWRRIVGIVPDLFTPWDYYQERMGTAAPEGIYVPLAQRIPKAVSVILRTQGAPGELVPTLRREVASIDPRLAVTNVETIAAKVASATSEWRMLSTAFSTLGLTALILAGIGLYGVVDLSFRRRVRELGIRASLGARKSHVIVELLRRPAWQTGLGLLLGLGLSLAAVRFLRSLLVGVTALDASSFAFAAVLLWLVVLGGCWGPVRSALGLNPARVLRQE